MKTFKIAFLSLLVVFTTFTSCSDNESVDIPQNGADSSSMRTAINRLSGQLDANGNIDTSRNPTGNMVFDFGFSIQFPITLIYNNGTTVTVNNIDELIDVAANVTDELYIDGVEFPINVEVFNDETGAIEVVTINTEDELEELFDDINFEDGFNCQCTEEYAPVCVEIDDIDGETFVLTFPNACYALCEGFEQADFLDSCEGDYDDNYENDCFEFNFPLNIVTDDGETITIDSLEDLGNITYDMYYFTFEFPLTVTTDDEEVITVENETALFELIEDCYDDYYEDCELDLEAVQAALMSCDTIEVEIFDTNGELVDINTVSFNVNNELVVNGEPTVTDLGSWSVSASNESILLSMGGLGTFVALNGSWELVDCDYDSLEFANDGYMIHMDLDCGNDDDCDCSDDYMPVCVDTGNGIVEFDNMCELICEGFSQADIVNCEDDGGDNNDDCTEEDYVAALVACGWTSYGDQNEVTEYLFNPAGVVTIIDNDGNTYTGTWTITLPEEGDAYVSFAVEGNAVDTWYFLTCDIDTEVYTNSNTYVERDCE
jgi:hypothetical protein